MLYLTSPVFSKCASYIEEGRRLENLSWRLWTRETFCVEPDRSSDTSVLPLLRSGSNDTPELSASVESAASEQADKIENHIERPRYPDPRPALVRDDSLLNVGRGKEKHITSSGLERMVSNIKEKKNLEPITSTSPPVDTSASSVENNAPSPSPAPPSPSTATTDSTKTATTGPPTAEQLDQSAKSSSVTTPENEAAGPADKSASSLGIPVARQGLVRSPSIVRGFAPSLVSSSYRSQPKLGSEPEPAKTNGTTTTTSNKPVPVPLKKKGIFTLGGSSVDEDESSFEDRLAIRRQQQQQQQPATRKSSLSEELGKSGPRKSIATSNKNTSFRDEAIKEGAAEDEGAVVTDDDDISESAIDDEVDSDWEDSVTESGRSSVDDRLFQRVDSRANLVSRPSMLTMMMQQPPKMRERMNPTRSTSALQRARPNGPSVPDSPPGDIDEGNLTMRSRDVPRSKPIIVKPVPPQSSGAHSPRTTRRNMLATELTESLRRHLLWERQQKSTTANAVLKRRHTSHDVANLQEYPQPQSSDGDKQKDGIRNGSWTNYTDFGPWEYHAKGW